MIVKWVPLNYVDCPIIHVELVMQILHQLPPSYHCIFYIITHCEPFPTFLEAKKYANYYTSLIKSMLSDSFSIPLKHCTYYMSDNNGKGIGKIIKTRTILSFQINQQNILINSTITYFE